jgi:hypothetical protein
MHRHQHGDRLSKAALCFFRQAVQHQHCVAALCTVNDPVNSPLAAKEQAALFFRLKKRV